MRIHVSRQNRVMSTVLSMILSAGAVAVLLLGLAACTSDADRAAEQARLDDIDHHDCMELGFEPGTDEYGNCRLKLKEIRAKEEAIRNRPNVGFGVGIGISKGF